MSSLSMMRSDPRAAWGGLVGPVAFVAGWAAGGALTQRDYSPVDDAISRLAAVGADTRSLMTAGFVTFGVALPVYASALRTTTAGPAWVAAAATGMATVGVALTPLDHSSTIDTWHAIFAGAGYVTLAAIPLLAARPLWRTGLRQLSAAGVVAGTVAAVSLLLTTTGHRTGLFQRLGLTVVDVWVAASALTIVRRRAASVSP